MPANATWRTHSGKVELCMARQRLGSNPLVALQKLVVRPLATPQTIGAFYRGPAQSRNRRLPFWMYLIVSHISTLDVHQEVVVKADSLKFAK